MQDKTVTSRSGTPTVSRLPTRDDGTVDLITLGRVEQKVRTKRRLNADEQAMYDEALEHPQGARMLMEAAHAYEEYLEGTVRNHGGTIVINRWRWRNGTRTSETSIQRFGHRGDAELRPTGRSGSGRRASGTR